MAKQKVNKLIESVNSIVGLCKTEFRMAMQEQLLKMVEDDKELYLKANPYIQTAMTEASKRLPYVREAEDF